MATFIDSLQTIPFEIYDQPTNLNAYTSLLFHIVRNRMIDSADMVRIGERKQNHVLDTVWQSQLFLEESFDSLAYKYNLKNDADKFKQGFELFRKKLEMDLDSGYFERVGEDIDSLNGQLFN